MNPEYRFGIEEEYFLADAVTHGTPRRQVKGFHAALRRRLPAVERELLQSQVEVASPPSTDFAETGAVLAGLRRDVATLAREHGILLLAAGTHPLARWTRQAHTEAERYQGLIDQLQILGRRNVACGMHVHVEVPQDADRIDLMNRLIPVLPVLLALSTSSPFWQGRPTGLAGYRLSVFGELPRTGLPELFADAADFERYVAAMTGAGAVADASFLWWTLRPSVKYPTLELRVADSCTRLEDSLAIAALYRCLVRRAVRQPQLHRGLTGASRGLVAENMWRAQRDGAKAAMIDIDSGAVQPFAEHLDGLLQAVAEDAEALGCATTLAGVRTILERGTSAAQQMAVFEAARGRGLSGREALAPVVEWLAAETAGRPA